MLYHTNNPPQAKIGSCSRCRILRNRVVVQSKVAYPWRVQ